MRGIVQVEQAEIARNHQQADQDLQDHIQAIGVGIAAGAIVPYTSGLITQDWYLPNGKKIEFFPMPHLFIICFASVLFYVGEWWIAKEVINIRRSPQKK